ncbi:MAG: biotin/lipoyl-containing protein, partial [Phycisphaerales bacterium]
MPLEITMPRLSDTMEVGTILHWHVKVGDEVSSGDLLADIETDKATMELQSFDDGFVESIAVEVGVPVDVGTLIATLAVEEGEDIATAPASAPTTVEKTPVKPPPPPRATSGGARVSPVARRLAEEHGIDLASVQGSGPSGRVIKRDILQLVAATTETTAAAQTTQSCTTEVVATSAPLSAAQPVKQVQVLAPTSPWQQDHTEPLSNMRQIIAKRLVESKQTIPHYQVTMDFDMDPLIEMRKTLNDQLANVGVKLSVNDFLVR